jgi:hypothetical protein
LPTSGAIADCRSKSNWQQDGGRRVQEHLCRDCDGRDVSRHYGQVDFGYPLGYEMDEESKTLVQLMQVRISELEKAEVNLLSRHKFP